MRRRLVLASGCTLALPSLALVIAGLLPVLLMARAQNPTK